MADGRGAGGCCVSPLAILALLLALSVAGNAVLAKVWLGADRRATAATEQRDQAAGVAKTCSDATDAVAETARIRAKAGLLETEKAAERAKTAAERANHERSAPVAPPEAPKAQACDLAEKQNAEWLANRKPKP